jgi:hypothetical protein
MYRPDPKLRPLRYAIPNPEGELWDAAFPHGGYEAEAVAELETGEVSGESPPFAKAAKDGDNAVVR